MSDLAATAVIARKLSSQEICLSRKAPSHLPVTKIGLEIENYRQNEYSKAFAAGDIPQELKDKWKVADLNHPSQVKFDQDIKKLLRSYLPKDFWDFDKQNVKFLYSESAEANAWFVNRSDPPVIVLARGMRSWQAVPLYTKDYFSHITRGMPDLGIEQGKKTQPIESISDLVAILAHELVHVKKAQEFGLHPNSKWEEATAYAQPVDVLHRAKLNPFAMFRVMGILSKPAVSIAEAIDGAIDPHPSSNNTLNCIRAALTNINYERGELESKEQVSPEQKKLFDSILERFGEFHYEHSIRRTLPADYEEKSEVEKVTYIRKIIDSASIYNWDAYLVAAELIEELDVNSACVKELKNLRDEVVVNSATRNPDASAQLYFAIQQALGEDLRKLPKQFESVESLASKFIESVIDSDEKLIQKTASEFTAAVSKHPQLSTSEGQAFASFLTWPQFSPVKVGEYPQWHILRNMSLESNEILQAAWLLGLQRDPWIPMALASNSKQMLDMQPILGYRMELGFFSELSVGPYAVSRSKIEYHLGSTLWRNDGRALSVSTKDDRPYAIGAIDNNQSKIDDILFLKLTQTLCAIALKSKKTKKEAQFLKQYRDLLDDRNFLEAKSLETILSRNLLLKEPAVFSYVAASCLLNSKIPDADEKVAKILLSVCGTEEGKQAFKKIDWKLIPIFEGEKKAVNQNNKLIEFLLTKTDGVYSYEDRRKILDDSYFKSVWIKDLEAFPLTKAIIQKYYPEVKDFKLQDILNVLDRNDLLEFEVNTLLVSAKNEIEKLPEPSQAKAVVDLLGKAPSDSWRDFSSFSSWLLAKKINFEESIKSSLINNDLSESIKNWSILSRNGLIDLDFRREVFLDLSSRLNSSPASVQRLALRLDMISSLLEEDYEFQKLIQPQIKEDLDRFGKDDGSEAYLKSLLEITKPLSRIKSQKRRVELFEQVSKKVVSQISLAKELDALGKGIKDPSWVKVKTSGIGIDLFLEAMSKYGSEFSNQRVALLNYLLNPKTANSTRSFIEKFFITKNVEFHKIENDWKEIQDKDLFVNLERDSYKLLCQAILICDNPVHKKHVSQETYDRMQKEIKKLTAAIESMHSQFNESSLAVRTVITHQILFPDGLEDKNYTRVRDLAIKLAAPGDSKQAQESRQLGMLYFDSTPALKREPLTTATIVAAYNNRSSSLGKTLVEVASSLDPAAVKTVQRMRGMKGVPLDVRQDTATAVYRIGEPPRLEVLKWVDALREDYEKERNAYENERGNLSANLKIEKVGEVVGCGSMGVNIRIQLSDGSSEILYILRPYAAENGKEGFQTFKRMAAKLPAQDQKRSILLNLLDGGEKRLRLEGDTSAAKVQYQLARERHHDGKVLAFGSELNFTAPEVKVATSYLGADKRNYSYFSMSEVQGEHLVEILSIPESEKINNPKIKALCAAILARELHLYLKYFFIEPDRNEGNIKNDGSLIAHIDFKALRPNPWSDEAITQVAPILIEALTKQFSEKSSFADFLENLGEGRERLLDESKDLLIEIETGLMSLIPYAEVLDNKSLAAIALGVLEAGLHPRIVEHITKRIPEAFRGMASMLLTSDLPKTEQDRAQKRMMLSLGLAPLGLSEFKDSFGQVQILQ